MEKNNKITFTRYPDKQESTKQSLLRTSLQNENPENHYKSEKLIMDLNGKIKFFNCKKLSSKKAYLLKKCKVFNDNEIKFMYNLQHDRIIKLVECFKINDDVSLVYPESLPILDFLSIRRKYSEAIVVQILRQLVDAVQWVHTNGYIHLNINPLSIFNSDSFYVNIKLSGFENLVSIVNKSDQKSFLIPPSIEFSGLIFNLIKFTNI